MRYKNNSLYDSKQFYGGHYVTKNNELRTFQAQQIKQGGKRKKNI